MVGQIHELVEEVGLAHLCGQGAELLVGGEGPPSGGLPQLPLLKHLAVPRQLYRPLLGTTCARSCISAPPEMTVCTLVERVLLLRSTL